MLKSSGWWCSICNKTFTHDEMSPEEFTQHLHKCVLWRSVRKVFDRMAVIIWIGVAAMWAFYQFVKGE